MEAWPSISESTFALTAYSPEEIQTLNEALRMCIFTCYPAIMYDPGYGAWYYYYFDTGAWYWA